MWRIVSTMQAEGGRPFVALYPRRFWTQRGAEKEAKRIVTEVRYIAIKHGVNASSSYKLIKEGDLS